MFTIVNPRHPATDPARLRCAQQPLSRLFAASSLIGAFALLCPVPTQTVHAQVRRLDKVNYLMNASDAPGAVAGAAIARGTPGVGSFTAVSVSGPEDLEVALARDGQFLHPLEAPVTSGMLVGAVYRFRVTNIPFRPGEELYPTVEVIDRVHAPTGREHRFPIPIVLTNEDLRLALDGALVTRVIYIEDSENAEPRAAQPGEQRTMDVAANDNALKIADQLGRPVAILRIGSRVPANLQGDLSGFLYGCPPWVPLPTAPDREAMIRDGLWQEHVPTEQPTQPYSEAPLEDIPRIPLYDIPSASTPSGDIASDDIASTAAPAKAVRQVGYHQMIESPSDQVLGQSTLLAAVPASNDSLAITISDPVVSFSEAACPPQSTCSNAECIANAGCQCQMMPMPNLLDAQEFIFDGGDQPPRAFVKKDWTAAGIDPTDTVIYYETVGGQVCIMPSNRVRIYAPRFGAIRQITGIILAARAVGTERILAPITPAGFKETDVTGNMTLPLAPQGERVVGMLDAFQENNGGIPIEQILPPMRMSNAQLPFENIKFFTTGVMLDHEIPVLGLILQNARTWFSPEAIAVAIDGQQASLIIDAKRAQDVHIYDIPGGCTMRICKAASHSIASPGDRIRFTIRFDNVGPKPLGNAVIMDSLAPRLEYIEGSQACSIGARFSTDANEVGSTVLRWEIEDPVATGSGGVISFDCLVR